METTPTKRAVLYCRVSTKEQVEEGNSLVTQEKNCREYAKKHGYEVAAVFIEQGESAKTTDRTELKKLMNFCAVKKNNISAVIAYKIDRISRNTDDYSQIRILLKRYGVEIKSTSEHFEDNPAGRFMENIIANVAQFDNDVRAERSIGGMKDAVREGRYVWLAPIGYSNAKVAGKSTIIQNDLAPVVKKAFEEVALNRQHIDEIRRQITKDGLVNTSGKPISKSHFYRILKNELYTGWIHKFGEKQKGTFEPIISEALFNQVQYVLTGRRNKIKSYSFERPDFPLRRFIRHPSGLMLTGGWSKGRLKKYPYYVIQKQNINIRKEVLEGAFIDMLNQFKLDITHFEKLKTYVKRHLDLGMSNKRFELDKLKQKATELKTKQDVILEKNIDGIISNELCKEKIAAIDHELYEINKVLTGLPDTKISYGYLLGLIGDMLKNPGDVWEKADFPTKLKLQWFYFPEGIEFDGKVNRTTKICKLFKLKEHVSPFHSYAVHHLNFKSNTVIRQISRPCLNEIEIESEEFWQGIGEEIKELASLKSKNSEVTNKPPPF